MGQAYSNVVDFLIGPVSCPKHHQNRSMYGLIISNSCTTYSGWWYTYPSEKYDFVSWDDDIPN